MDLYTWGTPNGHKVHIMLEECGAQCRIHPADINDKQAFADAISPISINKKIPVLIDAVPGNAKPVTIFESGAILVYLAEKFGRFLSTEPTERHAALQWLMFQMSAVGPMMGQFNHFKGRAKNGEDDAYALQRFGSEVQRIHAVMEQHLSASDYFAGAEYSIADMAIFPWLRLSEKLGIAWSAHPHLRDWFERVAARPAVQRALRIPDISSTSTT